MKISDFHGKSQIFAKILDFRENSDFREHLGDDFDFGVEYLWLAVLDIAIKVAEYRKEAAKDLEGLPDSRCAAKYLTDWLRARVLFANPETLAIFFWYLMFNVSELRVVRCKNKLTAYHKL